MKTFPKVRTVQPRAGKRLLVTFENGTRKLYDCRPLLDQETFEPLKDDSLFRLARADPGGYGISWTEDLDLSESELWEHGRLAEQGVEVAETEV